MSRTAPRAMPASEAWYWRLRQRLTPGLLNAQYAYFEQLEAALRPGDRWLDLGCGRRIVPAWLRQGRSLERRLIRRAGAVVGVDPDPQALADNTLPIVMHQGVAEQVPEPDASFDLITANMVVEHMDNPDAVLREAQRLLKPGGRLLFHTPNVWYPATLAAACVPGPLRRRITAWLEKRPSEDIYPTRYRLNSAGQVRRSAQRAGLQVASITQTADSPETVRLGPLVAIELTLIALTRTALFAGLRSNLVVELRKPMAGQQAGDVLQPACKPLGAAA